MSGRWSIRRSLGGLVHDSAGFGFGARFGFCESGLPLSGFGLTAFYCVLKVEDIVCIVFLGGFDGRMSEHSLNVLEQHSQAQHIDRKTVPETMGMKRFAHAESFAQFAQWSVEVGLHVRFHVLAAAVVEGISASAVNGGVGPFRPG